MTTEKTLLRHRDHEDVMPVSASAKAREKHVENYFVKCYLLLSYPIQIQIPCEPLRIATIRGWPLKYMRQGCSL
jgi:hypothetical protein